MAIYSLHHAPVGKGTQARPYTAAAHLRYVTRKSACTRLLSARMPARSAEARGWLRKQEDADRKNARVGDKVLLALPKELTAEQRAALLRSFAEEATKGRASWMAAIHDRGEDAHNPHCHLFIRDRDPETGKRACGMSERGSTERLRELWERHANLALERAGRPERIDRRTLAAQGIERKPTIHEGLSAREMTARGRPTRSRPINYRNGPGARSRDRIVDYRRFDKGRSRPAYNRHIRETEADYWAAIDADNIARRWAAEDAARLVPAGGADTVAKRDKKEPKNFLGRLAEKTGDFLHDPSKPVKRGRDAPVNDVSRISPDGRETWSKERASPREQQQMSLPEAVYKKGIKPAAEKAGQWLRGSEPEQAGAKERPSFSQKLADDRARAPVKKDKENERAATRDRWKREREKERER